MAFLLLIVGIWFLVAGVRNTQQDLYNLLKGDFTGSDNFVFWLIAILLIGTIGYIPKLRPVSVAFLVLIMVVLFLEKGSSSGIGGSFFAQFVSGITGSTATQQGTSPTQAQQLSAVNAQIGSLQQQISDTITRESEMNSQDSDNNASSF